MPKYRETAQHFFRRMVDTYPGIFKAETNALFCQLCQRPVLGKKVFNVKQHLTTQRHKSAEQKSNNASHWLTEPHTDIAEFKVAANETLREEEISSTQQNSPLCIEKEIVLNEETDDKSNELDNKSSKYHHLELEYLQLRNYKIKLEILEYERKLNIPPSQYTCNIGSTNSIIIEKKN